MHGNSLVVKQIDDQASGVSADDASSHHISAEPVCRSGDVEALAAGHLDDLQWAVDRSGVQ
jgi:hypothetical protein